MILSDFTGPNTCIFQNLFRNASQKLLGALAGVWIARWFQSWNPGSNAASFLVHRLHKLHKVVPDLCRWSCRICIRYAIANGRERTAFRNQSLRLWSLWRRGRLQGFIMGCTEGIGYHHLNLETFSWSSLKNNYFRLGHGYITSLKTLLVQEVVDSIVMLFLVILPYFLVTIIASTCDWWSKFIWIFVLFEISLVIVYLQESPLFQHIGTLSHPCSKIN